MDICKTSSAGILKQNGKKPLADFQAALNTLEHNNKTVQSNDLFRKLTSDLHMRNPGGRLLKAPSESENESSSSEDMSSTESTSSLSSEDEKSKKKSRKAKEKTSTKKKSPKKGSNDQRVQQLATLLAGLGSKPASSNPDGLLDLPLPPPPPGAVPAPNEEAIAQRVFELMKADQDAGNKKDKPPGKVGSKVAFKRVDQVYDRKIGNYKLKETVHDDPKRSEWDQVSFLFKTCDRS